MRCRCSAVLAICLVLHAAARAPPRSAWSGPSFVRNATAMLHDAASRHTAVSGVTPATRRKRKLQLQRGEAQNRSSCGDAGASGSASDREASGSGSVLSRPCALRAHCSAAAAIVCGGSAGNQAWADGHGMHNTTADGSTGARLLAAKHARISADNGDDGANAAEELTGAKGETMELDGQDNGQHEPPQLAEGSIAHTEAVGENGEETLERGWKCFVCNSTWVVISCAERQRHLEQCLCLFDEDAEDVEVAAPAPASPAVASVRVACEKSLNREKILHGRPAEAPQGSAGQGPAGEPLPPGGIGAGGGGTAAARRGEDSVHTDVETDVSETGVCHLCGASLMGLSPSDRCEHENRCLRDFEAAGWESEGDVGVPGGECGRETMVCRGEGGRDISGRDEHGEDVVECAGEVGVVYNEVGDDGRGGDVEGEGCWQQGQPSEGCWQQRQPPTPARAQSLAE